MLTSSRTRNTCSRVFIPARCDSWTSSAWTTSKLPPPVEPRRTPATFSPNSSVCSRSRSRRRCGRAAASGSALGSQQLHVGVQDPFSPATKAHPAFRVSPGRLDALADRLLDAGASVRRGTMPCLTFAGSTPKIRGAIGLSSWARTVWAATVRQRQTMRGRNRAELAVSQRDDHRPSAPCGVAERHLAQPQVAYTFPAASCETSRPTAPARPGVGLAAAWHTVAS